MARFNMSKEDIGKRQENEDFKDQNDRSCFAYGCPCRGTIYTGSWSCRYHDGVAGKNIDHLTMKLKNHELEIRWMDYILQSSIADYLVGVLDKSRIKKTEGSKNGKWEKEYITLNLAPEGMQPDKEEDFYAYRKRMEQYIKGLLNPLSIVSTHESR